MTFLLKFFVRCFLLAYLHNAVCSFVVPPSIPKVHHKAFSPLMSSFFPESMGADLDEIDIFEREDRVADEGLMKLEPCILIGVEDLSYHRLSGEEKVSREEGLIVDEGARRAKSEATSRKCYFSVDGFAVVGGMLPSLSPYPPSHPPPTSSPSSPLTLKINSPLTSH